MSQIGNTEELSVRMITVMFIIVYMFLANYTGQEIIDHGEHVYFTA